MCARWTRADSASAFAFVRRLLQDLLAARQERSTDDILEHAARAAGGFSPTLSPRSSASGSRLQRRAALVAAPPAHNRQPLTELQVASWMQALREARCVPFIVGRVGSPPAEWTSDPEDYMHMYS